MTGPYSYLKSHIKTRDKTASSKEAKENPPVETADFRDGPLAGGHFLAPPIECGLFKKKSRLPKAASAYWSIATMIA
jgi:hypothetical protein